MLWLLILLIVLLIMFMVLFPNRRTRPSRSFRRTPTQYTGGNRCSCPLKKRAMQYQSTSTPNDMNSVINIYPRFTGNVAFQDILGGRYAQVF